MLRGVTILSPHRDDAIFSLYLCLSCWSRLGIGLRVVNFFTISAYGPHAPAGGAKQISFLRQREDRKALARISPSIKVIDRDLLDAPIRLNISERAVSSQETQSLLTSDGIDIVAKQIPHVPPNSLVLAPLALGDHVDHLAVRAAVTRRIAPSKLAFYEDLPYATWTPKNLLEAHVTDTEHNLAARLKPAVVRSSHAVRRKRQAATIYQSQITWDEAAIISRWSAEYGGGERIWVPAGGHAWRSLIARSNAASCH